MAAASDPSGDSVSRRAFLSTVAAAASTAALAPALAARPAAQEKAPAAPPAAGGAICVSSSNGVAAVAKAYEEMAKGTAPVEAAVAGVNINELDPEDNTVGYGGLPNERASSSSTRPSWTVRATAPARSRRCATSRRRRAWRCSS